jgi:hypothetical protein
MTMAMLELCAQLFSCQMFKEMPNSSLWLGRQWRQEARKHVIPGPGALRKSLT